MRRWLLAGLAVATVAIAACGGDSPSAPAAPSTPVGTYNILSINGKTLPFSLFADTNYAYDVMSGNRVLTADGKYTVTTTFRQTIPGNVEAFVDTSSGTWTRVGSRVAFVDAIDATADTATWANGQLTFSALDGATLMTVVYSLKK